MRWIRSFVRENSTHTHTLLAHTLLFLLLLLSSSPSSIQQRFKVRRGERPNIVNTLQLLNPVAITLHTHIHTHTYTHSHKSAEPEYTRDYRQDSSIQNVWDWSFIGMGRIDIVDEVSVTLSIRAAGWLNENIWIWLCVFLRAFAYYYDISEVVVVVLVKEEVGESGERDATGNRIRLHSGTRRTGFD